MELTIESMFSPAGLLGNASYILLILSMAMRNMFWLRILAVFSGATGIIYDAFILHDPVGTFWESCFTLVNLVQWLWLSYDRRALKLTPDEQDLKSRYFKNVTDIELKQLLKCSKSIKVDSGACLTRQGEIVEHLFMLTSGNVEISYEGNTISTCGAGDLIGEIGFLTKSAASATSTATTKCEALQFNHEMISVLLKNSPELTITWNNIINQGLTQKLLRQNEANIAIQSQ
jgi:hypothetical protein